MDHAKWMGGGRFQIGSGGLELVCEAGLVGEEVGGLFGDGLGGLFEFVGDFEDGGGIVG